MSQKNDQAITKKIWFKDGAVELNRIIEEFNAGEDILYDQLMVGDDVWCSHCCAVGAR